MRKPDSQTTGEERKQAMKTRESLNTSRSSAGKTPPAMPTCPRPTRGGTERHGRRSLAATLLPWLVLLGLLISAPVSAMEFDQLPAELRELLSPFRQQWEGLPEPRQQKLLTGARRWLEMDAAQRQQAIGSFRRWQQLSPEERQAVLARYRKFQQLPPEQKTRLRQTFERFRSLSPEQRDKLRSRWNRLTPSQRQKLLQRLNTRRSPHSPGKR